MHSPLVEYGSIPYLVNLPEMRHPNWFKRKQQGRKEITFAMTLQFENRLATVSSDHLFPVSSL
jgi:hypothetical protein